MALLAFRHPGSPRGEHESPAQTLMLYYVAIFLSAEAAFILMAIKEYLQDLVGLTETDVILGSFRTPAARA